MGARVTVSDQSPREALDSKRVEELLGLGVSLELGGHRQETFERADLVVLSPGVPDGAPLLGKARAAGVPVLGEMELAARLTKAPILAITGTNGKSTVTSFLGAVLQRAGLRVFVGGNLGTPLMALVAEGRDVDWAVLEVSSFQLDTIDTFSPKVSVILNITPDHLDRYPNFEAYAASKFRIMENQGPGQVAVLNDEDETIRALTPTSTASVLRYGVEGKPGRQAWVQGERILAGFPRNELRSFDLRAYKLPGRHNLENLLAVVLGGLSAGVDPGVIQETIDAFQGLPNRLEWVGEYQGVRFVNDSKATNVDASARAVMSFGAPIILIAGGRHKGADYGPLVDAAGGRVKAVVLMGEARALLARAFKGFPCAAAADMEEAVSLAFDRARAGDVILLAPACSSFDMFKDYAHRGRAFKRAVERLIGGDQGHPKAGI
jgi:UDP-N-acetylmuramoylalanine--D-glutamate ligase